MSVTSGNTIISNFAIHNMSLEGALALPKRPHRGLQTMPHSHVKLTCASSCATARGACGDEPRNGGLAGLAKRSIATAPGINRKCLPQDSEGDDTS